MTTDGDIPLILQYVRENRYHKLYVSNLYACRNGNGKKKAVLHLMVARPRQNSIGMHGNND